MNVLDLFSGIGGFSLGLEAAGMHTVAFCEQAAYPAAVLRHHWPDTPIYDDVRTLSAERLAADGIVRPDLICGGFPCQDISFAGKGAGIEGERSGLWVEMHRIIHECRPAWVIAENVPALRSRGSDRVLADLEGSGYTCWPVVVGAVHAGAPHRRQRVWIVAAHADAPAMHRAAQQRREPHRDHAGSGAVAHAHAGQRDRAHEAIRPGRHAAGAGGADAAPGRDGRRILEPAAGPAAVECDVGEPQAFGPPAGDGGAWRRPAPTKPERPSEAVGEPGRARLAQREGAAGEWPHAAAGRAGWWSAEPDVGRVAYAIPSRVDRLKALGNAVVPACVEMIGAWIMQQNEVSA